MKTKDFKIYQREDGIIVYWLHNFNRTTVDSWAGILLETNHYYLTNNYHMRIITILDSIYPTAYSLKKLSSIIQESPKDLVTSVAMVAKNSLLVSIINPILQQLRTIQEMAIQVHYNEERAIHWLEQRKELILKERNIASITTLIYNDDMKLIQPQQ
jgi:hypothetical protein